MSTLQGKWALVTGASSGLGVEFAKLFAERRANLVLVARRMEPMNRLAEELTRKHSVRIVVIGMDLSRPGAAAELKSDLDARGIAIGSLVNNAGYGMYGGFLDQKLEAISGMMRVNMLALTELTHIFGRDMVKRREGQILMLASLLGYQAVPIAGQRMSLLLRLMIMKPHSIARAGLAAMMGGRTTVTPGFLNKAAAFFDRLIPRPMQRAIFGRIMAG